MLRVDIKKYIYLDGFGWRLCAFVATQFRPGDDSFGRI